MVLTREEIQQKKQEFLKRREERRKLMEQMQQGVVPQQDLSLTYVPKTYTPQPYTYTPYVEKPYVFEANPKSIEPPKESLVPKSGAGWISPDGKYYALSEYQQHGDWVLQHYLWLKNQGFDIHLEDIKVKPYASQIRNMLASLGWIRIRRYSGWIIFTTKSPFKSYNTIKKFLQDHKESLYGVKVELTDSKEISRPEFEPITKVLRQELQKTYAALSSRDLLKTAQESGETPQEADDLSEQLSEEDEDLFDPEYAENEKMIKEPPLSPSRIRTLNASTIREIISTTNDPKILQMIYDNRPEHYGALMENASIDSSLAKQIFMDGAKGNIYINQAIVLDFMKKFKIADVFSVQELKSLGPVLDVICSTPIPDQESILQIIEAASNNGSLLYNLANNSNVSFDNLKLLSEKMKPTYRGEYYLRNLVRIYRKQTEDFSKFLNYVSETSTDSNVLYNIAQNTVTPTETLVRLSKTTDESMFQLVCENPNLPIENVLEMVVSPLFVPSNSFNTIERIVAYFNTNQQENISEPIAEAIYKNNNDAFRLFLASDQRTPETILIKLSEDESGRIREELKKNPNPKAKELYETGKNKLQECVNTSDEKRMLELVTNSSDFLKRYLIRNEHITELVLQKISETTDEEDILDIVIENPKSNPQTITNCLKNERVTRNAINKFNNGGYNSKNDMEFKKNLIKSDKFLLELFNRNDAKSIYNSFGSGQNNLRDELFRRYMEVKNVKKFNTEKDTHVTTPKIKKPEKSTNNTSPDYESGEEFYSMLLKRQELQYKYNKLKEYYSYKEVPEDSKLPVIQFNLIEVNKRLMRYMYHIIWLWRKRRIGDRARRIKEMTANEARLSELRAAMNSYNVDQQSITIEKALNTMHSSGDMIEHMALDKYRLDYLSDMDTSLWDRQLEHISRDNKQIKISTRDSFKNIFSKLTQEDLNDITKLKEDDQYRLVRRTKNPIILEILSKSKFPHIRAMICENVHTNLTTLKKLFNENTKEILNYLSCNINIDEEIRNKLIDKNDDDIFINLLIKENLSPKQVELIYNKTKSINVSTCIVRCEKTPPNIIKDLYNKIIKGSFGQYKDQMLKTVASNKNTPKEVLFDIHKKSSNFDRALCSNENIGVSLLTSLYNKHKKSPNFMETIIENIGTPKELLQNYWNIIKKDEERIRNHYLDFLNNINTPENILAGIIKSKNLDEEDVYKLLEFPNLSEKIIAMIFSFIFSYLSEDLENPGILMEMCFNHKNTTEKLKRLLLNNKNFLGWIESDDMNNLGFINNLNISREQKNKLFNLNNKKIIPFSQVEKQRSIESGEQLLSVLLKRQELQYKYDKLKSLYDSSGDVKTLKYPKYLGDPDDSKLPIIKHELLNVNNFALKYMSSIISEWRDERIGDRASRIEEMKQNERLLSEIELAISSNDVEKQRMACEKALNTIHSNGDMTEHYGIDIAFLDYLSNMDTSIWDKQLEHMASNNNDIILSYRTI